jgi:hypothetical protein
MSSLTYAHHQYEGFPPGDDAFASTAQVQIQLLSPPFPPMLPLTVMLSGPTKVHRGLPFNPGDGRWEIPTEMVLMNLQGADPMIGPVTVIESPTLVSSGQIRQQVAGHDFPAESFFDVFFEIQTTPMTLFNKAPKYMVALIDTIPPLDTTYRYADSVFLFDKTNPNGPPVAILTTAEHTPTGSIPTLSEWGAIIFGVLLLGSVVFYIWRRRRVAVA